MIMLDAFNALILEKTVCWRSERLLTRLSVCPTRILSQEHFGPGQNSVHCSVSSGLFSCIAHLRFGFILLVEASAFHRWMVLRAYKVKEYSAQIGWLSKILRHLSLVPLPLPVHSSLVSFRISVRRCLGPFVHRSVTLKCFSFRSLDTVFMDEHSESDSEAGKPRRGRPRQKSSGLK